MHVPVQCVYYTVLATVYSLLGILVISTNSLPLTIVCTTIYLTGMCVKPLWLHFKHAHLSWIIAAVCLSVPEVIIIDRLAQTSVALCVFYSILWVLGIIMYVGLGIRTIVEMTTSGSSGSSGPSGSAQQSVPTVKIPILGLGLGNQKSCPPEQDLGTVTGMYGTIPANAKNDTTLTVNNIF